MSQQVDVDLVCRSCTISSSRAIGDSVSADEYTDRAACRSEESECTDPVSSWCPKEFDSKAR